MKTENWFTLDQLIEAIEPEVGGAAAELLAREVGLHLAASNDILGWLTLGVKGGHPGMKQTTVGVVTVRHFLMVTITQDGKGNSIRVQSAPIGRLRSVLTTLQGNGRGGFMLDFAGPVFSVEGSMTPTSEVSYYLDKSWPTEEVRNFLAAVAEARK